MGTNPRAWQGTTPTHEASGLAPLNTARGWEASQGTSQWFELLVGSLKGGEVPSHGHQELQAEFGLAEPGAGRRLGHKADGKIPRGREGCKPGYLEVDWSQGGKTQGAEGTAA